MEINITCGLPGCGKTDFAKSIKHSIYYDIDSNAHRMDHVIKTLNGVLTQSSTHIVVLDGLFLSNSDIEKFFSKVIFKKHISLIVHYWEPNIENCLFNDKYRRNVSSEITIKNAKLSIDRDLLQKYMNINFDCIVSIVNHKTEKKPDWKFLSEKNNIHYTTIKSDTWSLGGTWANCWGGAGDIYTEEESDFSEFYDITKRICPDITEDDLEEIYSYIVTIDSDSERDYYGGCRDYSWKEFKMENLFSQLDERGYIRDIKINEILL
jgi:hypothetical protein